MQQEKETIRIEQETLEIYLGEEARPLIIACLLKDKDLAENLRLLQNVSLAFEKERLMVCYALDDMLPYFSNRFNVGGTPTFLMIASGVVLGTLLGKNSSTSIIQFVHEMLSGYKQAKSPCSIRKSMKPIKTTHQKKVERFR
jgi:hypothetical protein